MEKPDVFDRIMSCRLLKPLFPTYKKYKEVLLYLFFGGLAFLVNVGVFALTKLFLHHLAANVIAWIAGVLFAYFTNRVWVFGSEEKATGGIVKELMVFSGGRLATLGLEELLLWIGIDLMGLDTMLVKIVAQVAVTIANYVISKWVVFRKKPPEE